MFAVAIWIATYLLSAVLALDLAPTHVLLPHYKTNPPAQGNGIQYVETVYMATNHKTMLHTIEPLRPSYEVSYQSTSFSTVNNQTISTMNAEFATVLNTTILYQTDLVTNNTYDAAPTSYQTLDFTSQRITYTPVTGNTSSVVTVTEANALPFV